MSNAKLCLESNPERTETIEKIDAEISCIHTLLSEQYHEVIGDSRRRELERIDNKLRKFREKLVKDKFEISIVGLEKAGKSTFANALMGNDILPTKDARCTYTATRIEWGTDNIASVRFYSDEQFNEEFHNKLSLIGIEDTRHWTEWTEQMLDAEISVLPSLRPEQKNIANDIKEIINNRSSIRSLLDKVELTFSGDELEYEVKDYIETPAKALAVREIVISSEKLSEMPNAILYDVPGFDSPTQLHKDQTRAWMKKSDAVILIVNADRPSFNESLVRFFESIDKDDDGISIGEKLFIFANRADVASTLQQNLMQICNELTHYGIMPKHLIESRLIAGSAKAHIELENGNTNSSILYSLKEKGLESDGIDTIRHALTTYNGTIRLKVMKQRVENMKSLVTQLFQEIRNENEVRDDTDISYQMESMVDALKRKSRNIHDALAECRDNAVQQCREDKPITSKVRKSVIEMIDPDRYGITVEDIRKAQNDDLSGAGVLERFDASIRDKKFSIMYNEFIDSVVNLAVEEYRDSEKKILSAFEIGLDLTESHPNFTELEESLKTYINQQCGDISPEGYYNSLIRRYSRNLFEILISTPFGNNARYLKFEQERRNFYSLSLFTDKSDVQIRPDAQPMHYQILYHQQLTEDAPVSDEILMKLIVMTEDATNEVVAVNSRLYQLLENFCEKYCNAAETQLNRLLAQLPPAEPIEAFRIPLFAIHDNPAVTKLITLLEENLEDTQQENSTHLTIEEYNQFFLNYRKSLEAIPEEFHADVCILKKILNEQVMNAVCIEIPFLDLVKQNILSLQESLNTAAFTDFINREKAKILEDDYRKLMGEMEERKHRLEILQEIDKIFNS